MSALPYLSGLPPAQNTAIQNAPALSKAPSPLASGAETQDGSGMQSYDQMESSHELTQDKGQSFWQTLQQQAASSDPSLRQNLTALDNASNGNSQQPLLDVEELSVEEIQIEGLSENDNTMEQALVVAPWSMVALQLPADDGSMSSNPTMDQILSQRTARPQLQTQQASNLSVTDLQSKEGQFTQGVVAPLLNSDINKPIQGSLEAGVMSSQLSDQAPSQVQSLVQSQNLNSTAKNNALNSGLKLDESLLSDAEVNIHEKPLTLMPQGSPQVQNPTPAVPLTQVDSMPEMMDSVDGLQTLNQQNNKELTNSARLISTENQAQGKVFSGQEKFDVPPSSPKFTEQMAQRIGIMATEQLQTARIQLDPPELGSLEIKLKVQQDQVSVAFTSGNHVVRDALESQIPRLKEMLEQQGVELADVNVSDQQTQQGTAEENSDGSISDGDEEWVDDEMAEESIVSEVQSDSLVDYFA